MACTATCTMSMSMLILKLHCWNLLVARAQRTANTCIFLLRLPHEKFNAKRRRYEKSEKLLYVRRVRRALRAVWYTYTYPFLYSFWLLWWDREVESIWSWNILGMVMTSELTIVKVRRAGWTYSSLLWCRHWPCICTFEASRMRLAYRTPQVQESDLHTSSSWVVLFPGTSHMKDWIRLRTSHVYSSGEPFLTPDLRNICRDICVLLI